MQNEFVTIVFIESVSSLISDFGSKEGKEIFFCFQQDSDEIYQSFFRTHTCYDCMPKSGKVVLLDGHLSIRKAFFALVFNNVRTALVWNAENSSNNGLITISDFVEMLITAYDAKWVKAIDLSDFVSMKRKRELSFRVVLKLWKIHRSLNGNKISWKNIDRRSRSN